MNAKINQLILQFIKISQYAGMREDIVQAGGGNTSVKIARNRMLIKASGYQLTDITPGSGYSVVNPETITGFLYKNYNNSLPEDAERHLLEAALIEGQKPSIETFLHAATDVLTLHTHPVVVNVLATRRDGMNILQRLFPDALCVGYDTPGIRLAQRYFSEMIQEKAQDRAVIFLKNHGMIVTGKSAEEIIDTNEEVLCKIETCLELDMTAYHNSTELWRAFSEANHEGIVWKVTDENVLRTYREFGGIWPHEFCPDCLVYCGRRMLQIADHEDPLETIRLHMAKYGPVVVVEWRKALYIHALNVGKALEIQSVLSFSAQVMLHNRDRECEFLPEAEQNFLLHWDAEKYRQSLQK